MTEPWYEGIMWSWRAPDPTELPYTVLAAKTAAGKKFNVVQRWAQVALFALISVFGPNYAKQFYVARRIFDPRSSSANQPRVWSSPSAIKSAGNVDSVIVLFSKG